jgi:hypothetical protein
MLRCPFFPTSHVQAEPPSSNSWNALTPADPQPERVVPMTAEDDRHMREVRSQNPVLTQQYWVFYCHARPLSCHGSPMLPAALRLGQETPDTSALQAPALVYVGARLRLRWWCSAQLPTSYGLHATLTPARLLLRLQDLGCNPGDLMCSLLHWQCSGCGIHG